MDEERHTPATQVFTIHDILLANISSFTEKDSNLFIARTG
jgi:hypothetical protein